MFALTVVLSGMRVNGIVGGEELRSMSLGACSVCRLAWLIPNIVLNLVAASVIAAQQATLEAAIALAVFLPIVSDMSGCSGNQAVAVSIRELTLGLVKPYEVGRVFLKEISVGLINGAALGLILGLVATVWQGNVYLGLVVGGAMMLNTIIAVSLGGLIPLILKRFGKDPALASGPLLTTVTDLCGFFLVLSFAQMALHLLVN
jgi:magnesium transporter